VTVEHIADSRVTVQAARLEDVYVVTASGELDLCGADALRRELDRVHDAGAVRLIVDLLRVTFLDSTALGVLVGAAKRQRARGGRIVLAIDDPRTLRVFEVTGLDGVFSLERSLPAAIDAATVVALRGPS
jgi:anti-sigma B factor antagonist